MLVNEKKRAQKNLSLVNHSPQARGVEHHTKKIIMITTTHRCIITSYIFETNCDKVQPTKRYLFIQNIFNVNVKLWL